MLILALSVLIAFCLDSIKEESAEPIGPKMLQNRNQLKGEGEL